MKQQNKKKFHQTYMARFGLFLHPNLSIHLLILLIMNAICITSSIGVFEMFNYDLLSFSIMSLTLFILISTLIEVILKIFIFRHFTNIYLKSFGILPTLTQFVLFYLTQLILKDELVFTKFVNIIYLTLVFIVLRFFLIIIYQRYIMKKITRSI